MMRRAAPPAYGRIGAITGDARMTLFTAEGFIRAFCPEVAQATHMTFTDAIQACFTKYADFSGCATRSEFWWWVLFTAIASVALGQINHGLSSAFSIVTFLPGIAVGARRLHDTDRSGWWQLLYFIPLVGWIILIIWCAEVGKPNRYGSEPARPNMF